MELYPEVLESYIPGRYTAGVLRSSGSITAREAAQALKLAEEIAGVVRPYLWG